MHLFNLETNNHILLQTILIISIIAELCIILSFFTTFLNITPSKTKKFLFLLSSLCLAYIFSLLFPRRINFIVTYACITILLKLFFKSDLLKTIFTLSITSTINILIGLLVIPPYLKLYPLSAHILEFIPIYRIVYLILNYFVNTCILKIIKFYKLKLNVDYPFDKKTKILFSINFIVGIMALLLQTIFTFYNIGRQTLLSTLLTFICLTLYFLISLYNLNNTVKLNIIKDELRDCEEHNKTLSMLNDGIRCFKHDFDNIITTIGGFISTDDLGGLKNYYKELEKDTQSLNTLYLLNPKLLNNPRIV